MSDLSTRVTPPDPVGAFVAHSPSPIAGAAGGALAGLSFAVKDLFDIAGHVTGGGSPDWLRTHAPATATAPVVLRLLAAGADFIGKTVCDELFYSVAGENAHYGTPVNVRAAGRIPGGSSSGSAAAVAAALCDFALGSDTGGSVRVPAAFCGLYGVRPTHGRVDLSHAMAMAPSFDTGGWFAREATLLACIGATVLNADSVRTPVTRVLLALDAFAEADLEVHDALNDFITRQRDCLPTLSAVQLAPQGLDVWRECLRIAQGHEVWQQFGEWIKQVQPQLGPGIRERIAMASSINNDAAATAALLRADIAAHVATLVPPGTVLCLPTTPCIAPLRNLDGSASDRFRRRTMALTCAASLSGHPQITLPAGTVDGCPIAMSLLGWRGADEDLLALAITLAA